jgi:hypothetical protein
MRKRLSLLACTLMLIGLPLHAELLQANLSIFGMD